MGNSFSDGQPCFSRHHLLKANIHGVTCCATWLCNKSCKLPWTFPHNFYHTTRDKKQSSFSHTFLTGSTCVRIRVCWGLEAMLTFWFQEEVWIRLGLLVEVWICWGLSNWNSHVAEIDLSMCMERSNSLKNNMSTAVLVHDSSSLQVSTHRERWSKHVTGWQLGCSIWLRPTYTGNFCHATVVSLSLTFSLIIPTFSLISNALSLIILFHLNDHLSHLVVFFYLFASFSFPFISSDPTSNAIPSVSFYSVAISPFCISWRMSKDLNVLQESLFTAICPI